MVVIAFFIVVSAATLTVALGLREAADAPFERTFRATNGADVVISARRVGDELPALSNAIGVSAASGPVHYVYTSARYRGRDFGLMLAGQVPGRVVGSPFVVVGRAPSAAGVVVERSFARRFGLRPGAVLAIGTPSGSARLSVAGIAVTTSRGGYPRTQPGIAWVRPSIIALVEPRRSRWGVLEMLRLSPGYGAGAFAAQLESRLPGRFAISTYEQRAAEANAQTRDNRKVLAILSIFLAGSVGFIVATLVGGQVVSRRRQVGLLKALGLGPRAVAFVFVAEYIALSLCALIGIVVGTIALPRFVSTTSAVLGGPSPAAFDLGRAGFVFLIVFGLILFFAAVPAIRSARRTTMHVLTPDPRAASRGRFRVASLTTSRLSLLPVHLGARDTFRSPGRALLTVLSLSLSVAILVATMALETGWNRTAERRGLEQTRQPAPPPTTERTLPFIDGVEAPVIFRHGQALWHGFDAGSSAVASDRGRLRPIVYTSAAILLLVALANLFATTLLSVRERTRELGIFKALGLTPAQLTTALAANNAVVAGIAGFVGVPLGLLTYALAAGRNDVPALWWLALVPLITVVATTLVSFLPAHVATRGQTIDALRHD
jgi:ABC-type lipoprotein release transport system permease subunit